MRNLRQARSLSLAVTGRTSSSSSNHYYNYKATHHPSVVVVVVALATLIGQTDGFCPLECHCQARNVTCTPSDGRKLDIIPITLNPMIRRLTLRGNNIRIVDASFQFYSQESVQQIGRFTDQIGD